MSAVDVLVPPCESPPDDELNLRGFPRDGELLTIFIACLVRMLVLRGPLQYFGFTTLIASFWSNAPYRSRTDWALSATFFRDPYWCSARQQRGFQQTEWVAPSTNSTLRDFLLSSGPQPNIFSINIASIIPTSSIFGEVCALLHPAQLHWNLWISVSIETRRRQKINLMLFCCKHWRSSVTLLASSLLLQPAR